MTDDAIDLTDAEAARRKAATFIRSEGQNRVAIIDPATGLVLERRGSKAEALARALVLMQRGRLS